MSIRYKKDILDALKTAGFSTYKIRKEKLMGEATLQKIRNGELVSWDNIDTICRLLGCQPGDLVEYVEELSRE
jgi:putative transcriptional regulator